MSRTAVRVRSSALLLLTTYIDAAIADNNFDSNLGGTTQYFANHESLLALKKSPYLYGFCGQMNLDDL
jgi:hypothetical protein